MQDKIVKAVHDDDMITLLKSLDIYENVKSGECKCVFCDDIINLANIDAILPLNEEIRVSCHKEKCHIKLLTLLGGEEDESR